MRSVDRVRGFFAQRGLKPGSHAALSDTSELMALDAEGRWIRRDKLAPGTQDRVSIMYQFMFMAPEKLQRLEFTMTNGRKLDRYRYTVSSGVEIDTPLGRMTTLHLVKQHRPDESGTEIWLSPQHRYLPVRVLVLEEDGSRYEQFITRLDIAP